MSHERRSISQSPHETAIGTFRAGYGHIRAALAIEDALADIGIDSRHIDMGDARYPALSQWVIRGQRLALDMGYTLFPKTYLRASRTSTQGVMRTLSDMTCLADGTTFDNQHNAKAVVASHMTIADLTQSDNVLLLGLDPAPGLYNTKNKKAITVVPDIETGRGLLDISDREVVVTGPILAAPIIQARRRFPERYEALQNGAGLRVTIATGGSLTHGGEIMRVTKAFMERMRDSREAYTAFERVSVVIGDSDTWYRGGNMLAQYERLMNREDIPEYIKKKFALIYDVDTIRLIRKADLAMGESDIIFAKTGELAYNVAGGKVFEAFSRSPSLAAQEEQIRVFVERMAKSDMVHALEQSVPDEYSEIEKLLVQRESGLLFKRMLAGLNVPVEGASVVAKMIDNMIKKAT